MVTEIHIGRCKKNDFTEKREWIYGDNSMLSYKGGTENHRGGRKIVPRKLSTDARH